MKSQFEILFKERDQLTFASKNEFEKLNLHLPDYSIRKCPPSRYTTGNVKNTVKNRCVLTNTGVFKDVRTLKINILNWLLVVQDFLFDRYSLCSLSRESSIECQRRSRHVIRFTCYSPYISSPLCRFTQIGSSDWSMLPCHLLRANCHKVDVIMLIMKRIAKLVALIEHDFQEITFIGHHKLQLYALFSSP